MKSALSTVAKHVHSDTHYLTIPARLASDSAFPFKDGDTVEIVIVGKKLEVRKP